MDYELNIFHLEVSEKQIKRHIIKRYMMFGVPFFLYFASLFLNYYGLYGRLKEEQITYSTIAGTCFGISALFFIPLVRKLKLYSWIPSLVMMTAYSFFLIFGEDFFDLQDIC